MRLTLLAAFCTARTAELTDASVTHLVDIVHHINVKVERRVEPNFVVKFRRVHNKDRILERLLEAALGNPDGTVREVLFPVVDEQILWDLLREYKEKGASASRFTPSCAAPTAGGLSFTQPPVRLEESRPSQARAVCAQLMIHSSSS
ncbi:hypothetical protein [Deinococcus humi]|uniref:Uncharacterized protein n=1 Tax=Deinococcus humi TaxID=662880 RepID=A0A7W8JWM1_9DEIO|nr:hypothetical protein [Deinococcus humi]MBB5364489.1 hypothetical protein [Deinococcus humi]GGO32931.1 hypothetical protein GCM10008949_31320 [Deinococcus humi]